MKGYDIMKATTRTRRWLKRPVLASLLLLGLVAPLLGTTHSALAQRNWCDYVAERGITASSDYWVGYWWKVGNAHGCWD